MVSVDTPKKVIVDEESPLLGEESSRDNLGSRIT